MKISDFKQIVQSIFFVIMLVFFLTMLLCVSIFSESLIELQQSKMEQIKKLTYQKVLLEERFIFEEVMSMSHEALNMRFDKISESVGLVGTKINLILNKECQIGSCGKIKEISSKESGLTRVENSKVLTIVYIMSLSDIQYGVLSFEIPQSNFNVSLSFKEQFLLYLLPFTILISTWLIWYFYIEKKVISPFISKLITTEKERAILKVTRQVAHDIRSPLAALEIVMEDIKNLPEESRELTLHAINRIQDIANNLSKDRADNKLLKASLISVSVAGIINEKIIEYQNIDKVNINYLDSSSRCSFVNINESDFSRMISNVVNNSVESLGNVGEINIKLYEDKEFICLEITDSGNGFPREILDEPLSRGRSIGKLSGQGIGLFHAHEVIAEVGGKFELCNTASGGARVTMIFPIAIPPKWFRRTVRINSAETVIIIDDDKSIHDVWRKLLGEKQSVNSIVDVFGLSEAEELLRGNISNTKVLIDYDLRQEMNGIQLIEKYNLKNVALVTSNYDTYDVVQYCSENNIQLIPKQIVSAIEIV